MKFHTFGDINQPAIIMLTGSFCPSESIAIYLTSKQKQEVENYIGGAVFINRANKMLLTGKDVIDLFDIINENQI